MSSLTPLIRRAALGAVLAGAAACAPFETQPPPVAPLGPTLAPATGMDFTRTLIVDFSDGPADPAGYVVEVLEVPEGLADQRPWPVGTWLVQDLDFQLVGFISPSGTAYIFDEDDVAHTTAFGSRDMSVASILKRQGTPRLRDA